MIFIFYILIDYFRWIFFTSLKAFSICNKQVLWIYLSISLANIYLFKVKNRNTRKRYKISSKLTIRYQIDVNVVLLLVLNISQTFFKCFYCWLWIGKCLLVRFLKVLCQSFCFWNFSLKINLANKKKETENNRAILFFGDYIADSVTFSLVSLWGGFITSK